MEQLYPTASHKSGSIKSVFQAFIEEGKMKVESSPHLHHTCSIKTLLWISLMPLAEADVFPSPFPELQLEIKMYFSTFCKKNITCPKASKYYMSECRRHATVFNKTQQESVWIFTTEL